MSSTTRQPRCAPRLIVAGASGDSGKTTLTLGLIRALRRRGVVVQPFKKGPDFIDPAWLGRACESVAHNLDARLCGEDAVRQVFSRHAPTEGISIIEGNRGLFDGGDAKGTHSTASLARMLDAPVVLVVNASKVTRTLAAVVLGCKVLEPGTRLEGVVLNRIAGERHLRVAREAIEESTGVRVVGALRRVDQELIPSRHLGLLTPEEHAAAEQALGRVEQLVEEGVDLEAVSSIAHAASAWVDIEPEVESGRGTGERVRIGVLRDSAFTFYYPENLEALEREGAIIEPISALTDRGLGAVDVLYVGGGFPETHAEALSSNRALMEELGERAKGGLPVYAECGGLMYLARSLRVGEQVHEMAGMLPVDTAMQGTPVGHGYVDVEVVGDNPFFARGARFSGHEFHYSRVEGGIGAARLVFEMRRGRGIIGKGEGICLGNILATYVHVHALGARGWARGLVEAGRRGRRAARSPT